jgi:GTPase
MAIEHIHFKHKKCYKKARPIGIEKDFGNMEYKLKITHKPDSWRYKQLTTQMLFRINEGNGCAIYNIGYNDDGEPVGVDFDLLMQSCSAIRKIATSIQADLKSMTVLKGWDGHVANIYINQEPYDDRLFPDF